MSLVKVQTRLFVMAPASPFNIGRLKWRRIVVTVDRRRTGKRKETIELGKKHKDWSEDDWRRVLFSDKSHFCSRIQSKIRSLFTHEKLREEHFVQTVKHPDKKMFWDCFSINGPGLLVPVEGMMNSKAYLQIIERKVCRELSDLHPRVIF